MKLAPIVDPWYKIYDIQPDDLVVAIQDELRGIDCVGIVVKISKSQAYIIWGSESSPEGWWHFRQLRKLS